MNFFVNGDIELIDIIDSLNQFGKVVEITFKTYMNTPMKTGEHTAYM